MAARYWVGGGSSANWNATGNTNWSGTSGGANNASVPTSADDVYFDGSGNSNSTISAAITILSLTIDAGYTSTMTHNANLQVNGNITFHNGYTIAGTGLLVLGSGTKTITSGGKIWPNNVTLISASVTDTLVGDWEISGTLTQLGNNRVINRTTSEKLIINGIVTSTAGSPGSITGTAEIVMKSGTWSGQAAIGNNFTLNGNITVSGAVTYGGNTLKYDSTGGPYTITTTSSTLRFTVTSGTIVDTDGINWDNITFLAGVPTLTINSTLNANQIGFINSTIFTGTHGFNVNVLLCNLVSAFTCTLQHSITYNINNQFLCFSSRVGSIILFTSSSATLRANLILNNPSTCNVLASFTRIDASGGRTINTFNGVLTDVINIRSFNDLQTVAST